ncbi:MAG: S-layer homology domain-containing protein [Candidatus Gracilibacteria bacterium]|jgi:V8-like Glu-specific endopeptidase|nr:S-layer homology domain-containing protein [Candidatus Gracilibacteria bacterium]
MKKIIFGLFVSLMFSGVASASALQYFESIPSVVMIESFNEYGEELYGSGFFISTDSYILTVAHIIIDESTGKPYKTINICTIEDEYSNPYCEFSAKVIAFDKEKDLAILVPNYYLDEDENVTTEKVDIDTLQRPYIDMADFLPKIGEKIMILGFPYASQLSSITLTEGIVSGFSKDEEGVVKEIATDATINPGNSGGPVYNLDERVVGVVIAISTDGIGGNYGYVISNDLIYYWFMDLADQGFLNPEFVSEVFTNDESPTSNIGEPILPEDGSPIFSDVEVSHKYALAISYLKEWGILNGYSDGSFKPENEINRAELLKVLTLAAGHSPSEAYGNCFPDVKDGWFAPYVCFARTKGWINGYADGTFKPSQSVSKAEALKMIFNAFEIEVAGTDSDVYKDVKVGSWYTDFVYSADFLGILDDNGLFFQPNSNLRRGQLSEYIFRALSI